MSSPVRIYVDDRVVPYKDTKVDPYQTKLEIEGLLARWGIKRAGWLFDLEKDQVELEFQMLEMGPNDKPVTQWVKIQPPRIYDRPRKDPHSHRVLDKMERINWKVSLRVLHWWLKAHLEMTYLTGYDKTSMLLPFIETPTGQTIREVLVPQISMQLAVQPCLEDLRK